MGIIRNLVVEREGKNKKTGKEIYMVSIGGKEMDARLFDKGGIAKGHIKE